MRIQPTLPKGGYTIVPLRAANARTLIEQSIGRGLRLPYGKRTGVAAVDRLNIVAHDKFQEIIDEANRGDSPIRLKQVILDAPSADDKKVSVQVGSGAAARLGLTDAAPAVDPASAAAHGGSGGGEAKPAPTPVFTTEAEKQAARVVIEVIGKLETQRDLVPTSGALLTPEVQKVIQAEVAERVHNAWLKTIEDGVHTYDIFTEGISKEKVGTREFGAAVVAVDAAATARSRSATA